MYPQKVQVSIRRIQYEKAWAKVQEMQANDVVFEGPVIAVNRGGAIVLVEVSTIRQKGTVDATRYALRP